MKIVKYIGVFLGVIFIFSNVNAQIDYKKEYKYYEKICAKKSSYLLNEKACLGFEQYKSNSKSGVQQMKDSIKETGMNADELITLINKNRELIDKKQKQYNDIINKISNNKNRLVILEKDVVDRLGTMQYYGDQNQMIDIIMSSTNFEDLMTRIDGISLMNKNNIEAIYDLEKTTRDLESSKIMLKGELKTLIDTKQKQEQLLREFYRKEQALYTKSDSGGHATINEAIRNVDASKIKTTTGNWQLPIAHGIVTASTWYYVGGGWHPGVDLANKVGTPLLAPGNGIVLAQSNNGGGYGNHLVIITKKGDYVYTMLFGHLSQFTSVSQFDKGDVIAYTGNTGASTGPHVHVEVFRHNTNDIKMVISEYLKNKDYWFGLGYSNKGDCNRVCRLQPVDVFNLRLGQSF
ncbi:MAG: peptidoglycan DD-metalloendopeptidase family protein [Bacilli bacterium]|jgi:murein DD-endopeptidase MepM/ murein hydrolase activator NlpD|nr:peptidoglycan DD-metalloendopeptidase family protein [Bacilli bacterium]